MDNLLQKVLVFLTKPESELSIAFLAIFFVCFIYGLYQVISCYRKLSNFAKNAPTEYEKVKEKYTPNIFIQKFEHVIEAKEIKFEDMPNVFVSIGILGTFLGLGVAIQGAAALLNTDKVDLTQLNSVLSVIAFKFQTSVWGTCFSLIFQKLIIENYFVGKRRLIGKTTEELYENEISTRTTLERQLAELRDMQVNFNQYVGNSALFIEHTQDFGNRVQLLKENLNSFNQQLMDCLNTNQKLLTEHQVSVQKLNSDVLNEGFKQIDDINQKHREFQEQMTYLIAHKLEVWQKVFMRSENDYAMETQSALRKMLNETLEQARVEYSDSVRKMGDALEGFNDVLGNLNSQIDRIHQEVIQEHSKYAEINKETYKQVGKNIKATGNDYKSKIEQAYRDIKDICNSIDQTLHDTHESYNQTVVNLQNTLSRIEQKNIEFQSRYKKEDNEYREELLKQLDGLRKAIQEDLLNEQKTTNAMLKQQVKIITENISLCLKDDEEKVFQTKPAKLAKEKDIQAKPVKALKGKKDNTVISTIPEFLGFLKPKK